MCVLFFFSITVLQLLSCQKSNLWAILLLMAVQWIANGGARWHTPSPGMTVGCAFLLWRSYWVYLLPPPLLWVPLWIVVSPTHPPPVHALWCHLSQASTWCQGQALSTNMNSLFISYRAAWLYSGGQRGGALLTTLTLDSKHLLIWDGVQHALCLLEDRIRNICVRWDFLFLKTEGCQATRNLEGKVYHGSPLLMTVFL